MRDEADQGQCGRNPHECQHARAQVGLDVEVDRVVHEDVLEDAPHDGRDDRRDDGEQRSEEGEDQHGQGAEEDEAGPVVNMGLIVLVRIRR